MVRTGQRRFFARRAAPSIDAHSKATEAALAALDVPTAQPGYRRPALSSPEGEAVYRPILATSPLPQLPNVRPGASAAQLLPSQAVAVKRRLGLALMWNAILMLVLAIAVVGALRQPSLGTWSGAGFVAVLFAVGCSISVPIVKRAAAQAWLPTIEIAAEPVMTGAPVGIVLSHRAWGRPSALKVDVVCREIVTFSEGTAHHVEEQELIRLSATLKLEQPLRRTAQLTIPEDAPHSFESAHNSLEWSVELRADVPSWPDYSERFVFRVLPRPGAAS